MRWEEKKKRANEALVDRRSWDSGKLTWYLSYAEGGMFLYVLNFKYDTGNICKIHICVMGTECFVQNFTNVQYLDTYWYMLVVGRKILAPKPWAHHLYVIGPANFVLEERSGWIQHYEESNIHLCRIIYDTVPAD
jgi:hypothetical protein